MNTVTNRIQEHEYIGFCYHTCLHVMVPAQAFPSFTAGDKKMKIRKKVKNPFFSRFTKTNMSPEVRITVKKKSSLYLPKFLESKIENSLVLVLTLVGPPTNKVRIHGHSIRVWSCLRLIADSDVCGWPYSDAAAVIFCNLLLLPLPMLYLFLLFVIIFVLSLRT